MSMFKDVKHPDVFEVNTRLLLRSLGSDGKKAHFSSIPQSFLEQLAARGINYVWMMGVWTLREYEINPEAISPAMRKEFEDLLPGLSDADIDGSPYAIEDYVVDPALGGEEGLAELRERLGGLGMGLILDFIPNHFGAHTHWLHTHPEYFIEVGENAWNINRTTFYVPKSASGRYFAHGKDPYFEAWQDTIQVDYAFDGAHSFMTRHLVNVAAKCDGVRCDMAMLPVKKIFEKTWGSYVQWKGDEFWPAAIKTVKENYPGFLFIAECYWDMEAEMLEMGFDYSYDKTFYDRLNDSEALKAHYNADYWYLERTVRFLENHDEERVAGLLHLQQHMAAATLLAFSPGMRLWHAGQWQGRKKKVPVQLNRAPGEICACILWNDKEPSRCLCVEQFYGTILSLRDSKLVDTGAWERVKVGELPEGVFCWKWKSNGDELILMVNYSNLKKVFDFIGVFDPVDNEWTIKFPTGSALDSIRALQPWGIYLLSRN